MRKWNWQNKEVKLFQEEKPLWKHSAELVVFKTLGFPLSTVGIAQIS